MKIVLVSFWSPGSTEAASRRVRQYVRAIGSVLTVVSSPSRIRSDLHRKPKECDILYVNFPQFADQLYLANAGNSKFCFPIRRCVKTALMYTRNLINCFAIPDFRLIWSIRAVPQVLSLNPDILITTGPPMSTHWVGLLLRKLRRNLIWIADLQDKMIIDSANRLEIDLHKCTREWFARKVISDSSQIVCATNLIAKDCLRYAHGSVRGKLHIVELGWEQTNLPSRNDLPKSQFLEIKYFGNVDKMRPVEPFFRAIAQCAFKDTVRVQFFGTRNRDYVLRAAKCAGIENLVLVKPYISGECFIRELSSAFALLTIQGSAYSYALSSKVFDYLLTQSWILGLVPPESCEWELLARAGGSVTASPYDVDAVRNALENLQMFWRQERYAYRNKKAIQYLEPKRLETKLRRLIEQASEKLQTN